MGMPLTSCSTSSLKTLPDHFWPFQSPRGPHLSFWPFPSLSYALTSGPPDRVMQSPSPTFPHCAGHTVSAQQVKKGELDLPKPFPRLSACLHPHSLPRIPLEGYGPLSKDMIILKRKGSDVRSKVKGLSDIWGSKPKESNCMFNNS